MFSVMFDVSIAHEQGTQQAHTNRNKISSTTNT